MPIFQKLPANQQKIRQALHKVISEVDTLHTFVIHISPGPNPVPTFAIEDCGCVPDYKRMAADLVAVREKLASWLKH